MPSSNGKKKKSICPPSPILWSILKELKPIKEGRGLVERGEGNGVQKRTSRAAVLLPLTHNMSSKT